MGKVFKRLFIMLAVITVIAGGAGWWLLSYIAPDEQLDLTYSPIDVKQKALDMIKRFEPEVILTESDVNNLIKNHLQPDVTEDVRVDGARFHLNGNQLTADLNVTYRNRIPAQLRAEYRMEWQEPNLVLSPQSLAVKNIQLPLETLETIIVPLDLPVSDVVSLKDIEFENEEIKLHFKLNMPFK